MTPGGWIGIVAAVVLVWLLIVYNTLVSKRNAVKNAESGVDVQLKKRFELIPNLVATVKGYMAHERGLLERLVAIRSEALVRRGLPGAQGVGTRSAPPAVASGNRGANCRGTAVFQCRRDVVQRHRPVFPRIPRRGNLRLRPARLAFGGCQRTVLPRDGFPPPIGKRSADA